MTKKAENNHLLVLRFSALGDTAMTIPVLLAVTKKYPQLKITLVSRGFHRHLFENIDRVDFYEAKLSTTHKGVFGLRKLYTALKSLQIDAVADLHNVLRSNILKGFFALRGIKVVQIDKGRPEKKALTQAKGGSLERLKTTHERYAEVFKKLGYPISLGKEDVLVKKTLSENVLELTGTDSRKWIGIAPFAAHSGKMYGLDRMKKVIDELEKTNQYKIFLFGGGESEIQQLHSIAKGLKSVVSIAGKLSFKEELGLISNLDVMVSMDSANGHLAANYGIPVITLWGVTHPYAGFSPYNQPENNWLLSNREKYPLIPTSVYGNKVPHGYENVMDTISEANILSKIQEVLSAD